MSLPYDRVFNFAAGPSTLPVEVLEECKEGIFNYKGTGIGVMELSHRSKAFESIINEAEADLRTLLGIPEGYQVLFLQGGASLQFSMIPINFLGEGQTADYVISGTWAKKALEAAKLEKGTANVVYDGKAEGFKSMPDLSKLPLTAGASYVHMTSNETIQGIEFQSDPTVTAPLIADMSSDILSRPIDVSKYGMIYAGAQKNVGPSGLTLVIIRDDLVARVPEKAHPMLDYRLQAENKSLYNTPPCWSIYISGLVFKLLLKNGGLDAMAKRNAAKAGLLYDVIDASGGFYKGHSLKESRSNMNVTFVLPNDELSAAFISESKKLGLDGLKGHRSVGGIRASIYNAFPAEGCEVLAKFMKEFATKNG